MSLVDTLAGGLVEVMFLGALPIVVGLAVLDAVKRA